MKKSILLAFCVFFVFLFGCAQPTVTNTQTVIVQNDTLVETPIIAPNITIQVQQNMTEVNIAPAEDVKEFHVEAFQHGYEPNEIRVNEGDRVKITLITRDVGHSLNIAEYGINIPAQPGTPGDWEFVADKKGTFTWRCRIPCGAGHQSMNGTFVVE